MEWCIGVSVGRVCVLAWSGMRGAWGGEVWREGERAAGVVRWGRAGAEARGCAGRFRGRPRCDVVRYGWRGRLGMSGGEPWRGRPTYVTSGGLRITSLKILVLGGGVSSSCRYGVGDVVGGWSSGGFGGFFSVGQGC